jgi:hypothetical protein
VARFVTAFGRFQLNSVAPLTISAAIGHGIRLPLEYATSTVYKLVPVNHMLIVSRPVL